MVAHRGVSPARRFLPFGLVAQTSDAAGLTEGLFRPAAVEALGVLSWRYSSAMLASARRPCKKMRIFSSAENLRRVLRRMSITYLSAVSCGPDFCLICARLMGYDEPEFVAQGDQLDLAHKA